jgi:hypothetical protein
MNESVCHVLELLEDMKTLHLTRYPSNFMSLSFSGPLTRFTTRRMLV